MAFEVHPHAPGNPATDPLKVAKNSEQSSTFTQITGPPVISNSYEKMMYLRVAKSGTGAPPTLSLQTGLGPPVVATSTPTAVYRGPNPSDYVGDVQLFVAGEAAGVWQLRMGFDQNTSETWQLVIHNNDPVLDQEFTWVVAGSVAETAQPWIAVSPGILPISSLVNRQNSTDLKIEQSVQVANRGTAALTVTTVSPAPAAPLELRTPLPFTVPPGGVQDLVVRYTPPSTGPAQTAADVIVTAGPPDTTAGTSPGHNQRIQITAKAQALEIVLLLDDSGSMGWDPLGTFLPPNAPNARWSELESAANNFLDLLAHFGAGRGRFGVARFPAPDPNNPSTFDLVPMTDITPNMAAAQTAISNVEPFNSTPMGDGLSRVLGPPGYFSQQVDNRRWLILMSDGAHNSGTRNPRDFIAAGNSPLDRKISIFAVAYGIEGHTDVDHVLLKDLVDTSMLGQIRHVNEEGVTAITLAAQLRDTIKSGLTGATSPLDPTGRFIISTQREARHDVVITPYDSRAAFVLNWNTPDPGRLRLELITPAHNRLTPEDVQAGRFPGVQFRGGNRSQMYLVDPGFLPGQAGTWTFVVTHPQIIIGVADGVSGVSEFEDYLYDTVVDSTLRLELNADRDTYFAGDPITISARLTARGLPVRDAQVFLSTTRPGQSFTNWLAALTVPEQALQQARRELQGKDSTPILIKQRGAQIAGLTFPGSPAGLTLPMADQRRVGTYRATVPGTGTTVPERYTFYVTAIGVTIDGVSFRREAKIETRVMVRPHPAFTQVSVVEVGPGLAAVKVVPKDAFGNVLQVDPGVSSLDIVVKDGTIADIDTALDGSYTTLVSYNPKKKAPSVSLDYGGFKVVDPIRVNPFETFQYPDRVVEFVAGPVTRTNKHPDPEAALGTMVGRKPDQLVAIGANGRLAVAVDGHVIKSDADDDVTVFVADTPDLRSYRVEALNADNGDWVLLGDSIGVTQSFPLKNAGLVTTPAVRILDTSGRTRDADLNLLDGPGVNIRGVGFLSVVREPKRTLQPYPEIRKGARNHPVKTLQYLLRARDHRVAVDGVFGPDTDSAVRAFQKQKKLSVDGIAGPQTWRALIVTVQRGSEGDAVRGVQEEFQFRNLSGDPDKAPRVDGEFGPKTEAAVRAFQRAIAADVAHFPVDGIVGPLTWQALISGMLSG
ncbi:peptidoglycan-binding protein [Actinoplanes sp. NPDC051475]|uniref:peptidoglycan-binding protein n=1 Tax=Actinoplanes sp. NPDC051475 TaxID=3157225 RepID=UPI00345062C3